MEKAKADGVRCDVLDGKSVAHLQKVLKVDIGILIWPPTEWIGLHHVDLIGYRYESARGWSDLYHSRSHEQE